MEHVIQIGIGVDDEAVQKRVEKCAYDDILKSLIDDAKKTLGHTGYPQRIDQDRYVRNAASNLVDEHKDEIIEAAINRVYESVRRSKKFRDKLDETSNG